MGQWKGNVAVVKKRKKSRSKRKNKRKGLKLNARNIVLIILAILTVSLFAYIYYPLYSEWFSKKKAESKDIDSYRKELPNYSVFGIDISHYQKNIEWEKVFEEQKINFVIIRSTMGNEASDNKFQKNWQALKKTNSIRGAYHYYRPDEDSKKQAENYIKNVKLEQGDLPPIVDIEKYSSSKSIKALKNEILKWLEIVEEHYKITPMIYTYNYFYTKVFLDDMRFEKYPIWIAWYNTNQNPETIVKDWVFWQFSDKCIIKGIDAPVDINVFNGKLRDLDGLRIKN